MPTHRLTYVLEHLQRGLTTAEGPAATDAQLLSRFVAGRDEAAFAALVRRHGPMVLGVCRRLLRNPHDAEDAFQATFLVLVRRAGSVRKREAVGSWLYGVAHRTAREVRAVLARRRGHEVQVEALPQPAVLDPEVADWRPLLDRELFNLPEKYRAPLLLCDLQGKCRKEVARELGLPEGTLSSRLATARQLLARRLARSGLALSGGMLAVVLAEARAPASVPAVLFQSTIRAALGVATGQATLAGATSAHVAALTEGVLQTMFLIKLKTVAAVFGGVAILGLATGGVFYQERAGAADTQGKAGSKLTARADEDDNDPDRPAKPKELRRSADEAVARERELRMELEKARREVEMLRAEADKQRERAEAEQRRAEAVMMRLKEEVARVHEAEQAARQDAAKATYAAAVRQAQRTSNDYAARAGQAADRDAKTALEENQKRIVQIQQQINNHRKELQERLRQLDELEKRSLTELEKQRAELMTRMAQQHAERKAPPRAPADKLDLILQRLDQMERRLDRLERMKR